MARFLLCFTHHFDKSQFTKGQLNKNLNRHTTSLNTQSRCQVNKLRKHQRYKYIINYYLFWLLDLKEYSSFESIKPTGSIFLLNPLQHNLKIALFNIIQGTCSLYSDIQTYVVHTKRDLTFQLTKLICLVFSHTETSSSVLNSKCSFIIYAITCYSTERISIKLMGH